MKKQISDDLVLVLRDYGNYLVDQGGDRVKELEAIGALIEDLLVEVKTHHTKLFLSVGCEKAMVMSGAEQIIDRALQDGMSRKKYYKDVYKDVRKKVETFAELHGKSEIIDMQLLEEKT